MNRMHALILAASTTLLGCPSVHTMRSAEVLPAGKSEIVAHVGQNGFLATASGTVEGESDATSGAALIPWAAFSYRTGLGNNLDFQIKTDPSILPELGVAYQVVGVPGQGGFAASLYAGAKYLSSSAGSLAFVPVAALVDLPLGDASVTVKGGVMISSLSNESATETAVKPLVGISARVKLGGITLLPEVSYGELLSLDATSEDGADNVSASLGFLAWGIGFAF